MPPINQLKVSIPYDTTWSPRLAPPDLDEHGDELRAWLELSDE